MKTQQTFICRLVSVISSNACEVMRHWRLLNSVNDDWRTPWKTTSSTCLLVEFRSCRTLPRASATANSVMKLRVAVSAPGYWPSYIENESYCNIFNVHCTSTTCHIQYTNYFDHPCLQTASLQTGYISSDGLSVVLTRARLIVPAATGHHQPSARTKLYCWVTNMRENYLPRVITWKRNGQESKPRLPECKFYS